MITYQYVKLSRIVINVVCLQLPPSPPPLAPNVSSLSQGLVRSLLYCQCLELSLEDPSSPHVPAEKNEQWGSFGEKEFPGKWRLAVCSAFLLLQACVQLMAICLFLFWPHLLSVSKPLTSLLLWVEVGRKGEGQHIMKTQATVQIDGIKS